MNANRKIGSNRGRPRLWLQGKILEAAGLAPGDIYALKVGANKLRLRRLEDGEQPNAGEEPKPRKVSGKADMPIVDIAGDAIERAFPDSGTVSIRAVDGTLTAKGE
jgi:DNA (cytosine-5)-methyltransferase 1